jgi:hypothetical protein
MLQTLKRQPSLHSVLSQFFLLFSWTLVSLWNSVSTYMSYFQHLILLTCSTFWIYPYGFYDIGWISHIIIYLLLQDNAISTRSTLSLLMANVLNGMTHLSMDIQLMAFRFLELLVLNFPSSFPRYAEQVSGIQSCIAVFKVTCFASVVSKFVC